MGIWSSYRCAGRQHQCTAALLRAEQAPQCSVLVWTTGSQHTLGLCSYTCGDLVFIQVCSEPTEMHCSAGLGKLYCQLFSCAQQTRLTAGLCQCNYNYGDLLSYTCAESQHKCLLLKRVYAVPLHQYSAALLGTRYTLLLSVALHTSCQQILPCSDYTCAWLLLKHVCSTSPPIQCNLVGDTVHSLLLSVAAVHASCQQILP